MTTELPIVLCVDDEVEVLNGLSRDLGWDFEVLTADGGAKALEILKETPVAVIISDMRMPGMDGAAFLAKARELVPDTTRILLTGHADLDASIRAVNEGHIFRFLTKPCSSRELSEVLGHAVEQHRLVTAEKVLLEQTLRGAVSSLRATLSLVRPDVFGFADIVRRRAAALVAGVPQQTPQWTVDLALDLCMVPLITLAPDTVDLYLSGKLLFGHHKQAYENLPESVGRVLGTIPRLEGVCHILARQYASYQHRATDIPMTAYALRIATDFELLARHESLADAWSTVAGRAGRYHPDLIPRLEAALAQDAQLSIVELVRFEQLYVGHILAKPILTADGTPLVPEGTEITTPLKERLSNFAAGAGLTLPLYIFGR